MPHEMSWHRPPAHLWHRPPSILYGIDPLHALPKVTTRNFDAARNVMVTVPKSIVDGGVLLDADGASARVSGIKFQKLQS